MVIEFHKKKKNIFNLFVNVVIDSGFIQILDYEYLKNVIDNILYRNYSYRKYFYRNYSFQIYFIWFSMILSKTFSIQTMLSKIFSVLHIFYPIVIIKLKIKNLDRNAAIIVFKCSNLVNGTKATTLTMTSFLAYKNGFTAHVKQKKEIFKGLVINSQLIDCSD